MQKANSGFRHSRSLQVRKSRFPTATSNGHDERDSEEEARPISHSDVEEQPTSDFDMQQRINDMGTKSHAMAIHTSNMEWPINAVSGVPLRYKYSFLASLINCLLNQNHLDTYYELADLPIDVA